MPYEGQIIHFKGGVFDWMGELDQKPHKNGKNWYRILNPCMVRLFTDKEGKTNINLMGIQGNGDHYKRYVDIRVPEDSIMEIWTVNKDSDLYKDYKKESERIKSKIILAPNTGKITLQ